MRSLFIRLRLLFLLFFILGPYYATYFLWQWFVTKPQLITFKVRGISTQLVARRGYSDVAVLIQTFWEKGLNVPLADSAQFIIDAGANVGYTTVLLSNKFPKANILAIEPDNENFAMLCQNTAHCANIQVVHGALWSNRASLAIENPQDPSWMFRMVECSYNNPVAIHGYTIPDLMDLAKFEFIDLLKLDIEGAEKHIFATNVNHWLRKTSSILVEPHDRFVPGCTSLIFQVAQREAFNVSKYGEYLYLCRVPSMYDLELTKNE